MGRSVKVISSPGIRSPWIHCSFIPVFSQEIICWSQVFMNPASTNFIFLFSYKVEIKNVNTKNKTTLQSFKERKKKKMRKFFRRYRTHDNKWRAHLIFMKHWQFKKKSEGLYTKIKMFLQKSVHLIVMCKVLSLTLDNICMGHN